MVNLNRELNMETEAAIYFFTPKFYVFDNFSAHTVCIWGITFPTAEHAFQWKKFSVSHPQIAKSILSAKSAREAKVIANRNKEKILPSWHEIKVSVMEEILKAKMEQHEDAREKLRSTGNKIIVENSPTDDFWGIGPDGKGENMLGKIWMKIRDTI